MPYIDAIKSGDEVHVVERVNGVREYKVFKAEYVFYYEDPHGTYKTMWGLPCKRFSTNDYKEFQKELAIHSNKKIHESDISPIFRCLENNYLGKDTPLLNIGFFDIETDFDPARGFASPWDPFSRITAISIYLSHMEKLITLVLKPDIPEELDYHLTYEQAKEITDKFDDTILCKNEEELLDLFLILIEDVDCLSGWNSSGYDIPYIVNRVERILGKEATRRFCLWNKKPKKREYTKYKKTQATYDLIGRFHLDYLELYQKHNQQQLHSYRLDFVGEIEVKENKIPYEGTLDMLYKKDFEKFIAYNRQDTLLLYKIDRKRKFIELANQLAHANSVLFQTTMGSVALIEQAIVNETHQRGMVVSNKKRTTDKLEDIEDDYDLDDEDNEKVQGPAVGAFVADPKVGIHEQIGCCDINSLYPSTLRALNMGPETLVGQIRCHYTDDFIAARLKSGMEPAEVWHNVFAVLEFDMIHNKTDDILIVDLCDGGSQKLTAAEWYDVIFDEKNNYCISANGTIFRTDIEAIIPGLLAKWYDQRKLMQKDVAKYKKMADEETDAEKRKEYKALAEFWDQRQLARKILLNALYGGLLNQHMRFYDHRIGQSVTLSGRAIARHMNSKINELITGEYDINGEGLVYADTDSEISSTRHHTTVGNLTVEELFELCAIKWKNGEKEYSTDDKIKVLTFDPALNKAIYKHFNYVYRHKTSKEKWKITDQFGNEIIVTEDHSVMIERDNNLIEIKPKDILFDDLIISTNIGNIK